jgi:cation diffusion facilitator family transporter
MTLHDHSHGIWTHEHVYLSHGHGRAESRTRAAVIVTAVFMLVEIVAGLMLGSMALLADGIHMATHVAAMGLAAAAYWLARRHARNARFSFGSGKFGDLAAFSSAIILGLAGLGVGFESVTRLLAPSAINYADALFIAGIGLGVNLVSAFLLKDSHEHDHDHDHGYGHDHHQDNNLRAAYVHVLADAATSVLALAALTGGLYFGWRWLDPVVGIVGAAVILVWSFGLLRDAGLVLLDAEADPALAAEIRALVEKDYRAHVADLHLWHLGPGHRGLILSLVSADSATAEDIKQSLRARHPDLSHVTVEVAVCADCART